MKILCSCLSNCWGESEKYTVETIKQLVSQNLKVELLCLKESRLHIEANNIGIIIHPIKTTGLIHPFASLKVFAILRRCKFEIIYAQNYDDLLVIIPALKLIKNKIPLYLSEKFKTAGGKKSFMSNLIHKVFSLLKNKLVKKDLDVNGNNIIFNRHNN